MKTIVYNVRYKVLSTEQIYLDEGVSQEVYHSLCRNGDVRILSILPLYKGE